MISNHGGAPWDSWLHATMYSLRMQYGIEKSIFNKKDENGIQINAHLSGGPGLGFLVPYYIRYNRNNAVVIEAFDSNIHNFNNVIGTAGFLEGINEAKWALLDYGELIVNVLQPTERKFYELEAFWSNGKTIKYNSFNSRS